MTTIRNIYKKISIDNLYQKLNEVFDFEDEESNVFEEFNISIEYTLVEDFASQLDSLTAQFDDSPEAIQKKHGSISGEMDIGKSAVRSGVVAAANFAARKLGVRSVKKALTAEIMPIVGGNATVAGIISSIGIYVIPSIILGTIVNKTYTWIKKLITNWRMKPYKEFLKKEDYKGMKEYYDSKHSKSKAVNKAILKFIADYYGETIDKKNKTYKAIKAIFGEEMADNLVIMISELREQLKQIYKKRKTKKLKLMIKSLGG